MGPRIVSGLQVPEQAFPSTSCGLRTTSPHEVSIAAVADLTANRLFPWARIMSFAHDEARESLRQTRRSHRAPAEPASPVPLQSDSDRSKRAPLELCHGTVGFEAGSRISIDEYDIPSLRNEVALVGSNMSDGLQSLEPVSGVGIGVGLGVGIAIGIAILL
jgi:hypothetical protein